MNPELLTVVVIDTGHERHCFETALGVWREETNKKAHTTKIRYEDPDTGDEKVESIYKGRILYCVPTYEDSEFPNVDELIEDTTVFDESYWGHE